MYIIDTNITNILMYFFDGQMTTAQKERVKTIFATSFTMSVISKIEFLGFKDYMDDTQFETAKEFLSQATVIHLPDNIIDRTIRLRQQHRIKLADAMIAATWH